MEIESKGFLAHREERWHYAMDCVTHIEEHNCAKGCKRGLVDSIVFVDCGPGGSCGVLAQVAIEEPTTDLWDDGTVIHCLVREPLDVLE